MDGVRIDKYLCAARIYKSRTDAARAVVAGHVRLNAAMVKASHVVKIGDRIEAAAPRGAVVLVVLELQEKRQSPARARELYLDESPPPPPREERIAPRVRGAGRPTKRDRRATERLRGRL